MIQFKPFNLTDYRDCLIVTDERLSSLYKIAGDNVYLLPCGEQAKRFDEAQKLCGWFVSKNLQRDGHVVAIGGGSVGDTVGFACSVYKRGGVKLTHVPTTVIAQIDSSIGGKTALDVGNVKNAIGSFYQADTVIDVNFLKTLDKVQINSGLGELLKYRMLSKKADDVYNGEITEQVIKECVNYKQNICQQDPFDKNERHVLNLGHTLGHALELTYNIPHGVAVANGLYYEAQLAYKLNLCNEEYLHKCAREVINNFELYRLTDGVLNLIVNDKKNNGDKVGFVLPADFKTVYLPLSQVKELLLC